jgi:flagellar hook protein FlgE
MQIGEGVGVESVTQNFAQGTLSSTSVPTDLGISGNGFLQVKSPSDGATYATRAGDLRIDSNGYLVTSGGLRVQGLNDGSATFTASVVDGQLTYTMGTPTAPSTVGDLKISADASIAAGTLVNATGGAFTDAQVQAGAPKITSFGVDSAGNIKLSLNTGDSYTRGTVLLQNFQDPNALVQAPGNLYTNLNVANPIGGLTLSAANNTAGQGGNGTIVQGQLEGSNVDLTAQFADLITAQRSFQAGSRIITTTDTLLEEIVNLKH